MYPISVPIQAVGTQKRVSVYMPQVKSNKQIETKPVRVNTRNFFDLKNDVKVGTKEYAQIKDESTTKTKKGYGLPQDCK